MPRQLLLDGKVVADDWQYGDAGPVGSDGSILPFDQWRMERDAWLTSARRVGVAVSPTHDVELLAPDLARLGLIAVEFPGPSEGRGYSQARLLRERWQYRGELRAVGYVRQDQLFFLARCGFNAFELPEAELDSAPAAFATFSSAYQASNDAGLPFKLRHRF